MSMSHAAEISPVASSESSEGGTAVLPETAPPQRKPLPAPACHVCKLSPFR
jgi:hypothetical protein